MPQASYLILDHLDSIYQEIASKVLDLSKDLKNKYLYMGWNGAMLWNEIENKYRPGRECTATLMQNFDRIVKIISNENDIKTGESFNIVSLGCGSGEDDIIMLDILQKIHNGRLFNFNITTVDLSIELLAKGTERIERFVDRSPYLRSKVEKITGLCVDIEHLKDAKELIKSENKNLFHLLGLTLGNNNEIEFLKSIYNVMDEGDWLLLGVDFSAESPSLLQETKRSYTTGPEANTINKFLCSPLVFSYSYFQESYEKNFAVMEEFQFQKYKKVKVEHKEVIDAKISMVPDAVSLVRYHIYLNENDASRKCDFSNKYTKKGFVKFLKKLAESESINLKVYDEDLKRFGIKGSPQYLLLLRKEKTTKILTSTKRSGIILGASEFEK